MGGRVGFLVICLLLLFGRGVMGVQVVCEFYDSNLNELDLDPPTNLNSFFQSEGGTAENTTDVDTAKKMMVCGRESQFCYALWTTDNSSVNQSDFLPKFLKQGCWEASPPSTSTHTSQHSSGYCHRPNCTAYYKKNTLQPNHMHFCCCQGDYCNAEVVLEETDDTDDYYDILTPDEPINSRSVVYLFAVLFVFFISLIVGVVVFKILLDRRKSWKGEVVDDEVGEEQEEEHLINNDFMNLRRFNRKEDVFDLKMDLCSLLDGEIASGRWGRIYRTKSSEGGFGKSLAVKVYSHEHREFFENEKFIYECLGKDHPNILKYHGWTENPTSLVLAFDLIDYNLRDFLKTHTITCHQLVDILLGISRGVAYLHSGVSECNTAVAHRDLTTRNILINSTINHVSIADFGLSLLTRGSKYFWGGRERQAEFCSLAEAGTLRYMAPELLEGAVNLKDCENALKQADVYSLSLILWEVANSCGDLRVVEGNESGVFHQLPFDEEAGNKDVLNLEDVVRLVVQNRIRPGFHSWTDMGLTRALRDTLTESWDSEPDARLTSLCIVERINELKSSLNNKFVTKCGKALEKKRVVVIEDGPTGWVNRNPCLERNLFDNNQSGSVTDASSVVTVGTSLGGSTDSGGVGERKFINNGGMVVNQPRQIVVIQNIRR